MNYISLLIGVLDLLQIFAQGNGERIKDKIYERISAVSPCYRRLNATHQTGCSSKRGGSLGVIHYCGSITDLNFILSSGISPPYIPILPTSIFNISTLLKIINSQKVSGVILYSEVENERLPSFTHEYQCPNPTSSLNESCDAESPWNPLGTGIMHMDIPFPIFYVESDLEVLRMKDCFAKFNNFSFDDQNDRSLCSLELGAFMYATTNTPTCIRRSNIITNLNPVKFCDPLGDSNIWASLHPLVENDNKNNETKPLKDYKYIVIAARLDTTSLFEKTAGASNPVTSIVTLLTVAKYLKEMLNQEDVKKAKTSVLFFLFNGETYDYIGSQRMLYDMMNGTFPVEGLEPNNTILPLIKPDDIKLYIEISQLGNDREKIFIHYLKAQNVVEDFFKYLQKNIKNINMTYSEVPSSVPPSSLHTFLKNNTNFPGLVISDHHKSYANHYYNSLYDNSSNIQYTYRNVSDDDDQIFPKDSIQQFIANVAELIGKTVYQLINNKQYDGIKNVSKVLVDELFHCYLEDPNCKVYQGTHGKKMPLQPLSLYVGVEPVAAHSTALTSSILRWFTGDIVGDGDANCTNTPRNYAFEYYNMSQSLNELNVTKCFKVTLNKTDAVSPAFKIPDYDWLSGEYSSWTESTWSDIKIRMFLRPSSAHEKMTMAIGSISVIFSFILVYLLKSRSHILFTESVPTEPPTDC